MMNNVQHNHQYISKNIFIYFCSPQRGRIFVSKHNPRLYTPIIPKKGKIVRLFFIFFHFFEVIYKQIRFKTLYSIKK